VWLVKPLGTLINLIRRAFLTEKATCSRGIPAILVNSSDDQVNNPITSKLAGMNDKGKSFKVIAAWIRKNL
jgi:hypothetical protein